MSAPVSAQALWQADALWPGAAIVARLQQQVPALRQVFTIDELDPAAPGPKQWPAALVLLDQMRPTDANPQRPAALVQQDWLVALAVRAPGPGEGRNMAEAGPLIPPVVRALHGWAPSGQLRALAWRPGMRPHYGRNGSYFPLVFSLQVVTT